MQVSIQLDTVTTCIPGKASSVPRAGLDILEEREISCPWREPNRYFRAVKTVAQSLYLRRYPSSFEMEVTRKMSGKFSDVRRCVLRQSLEENSGLIRRLNLSYKLQLD
jgi:hypothetical protein